MSQQQIEQIKNRLTLAASAAEWRRLLTFKHLYADFQAGLIVALIAIPLSLSIAWASGIPPLVGIYTAIVASAITTFFGGTRYGVSGPAAALCILIANIISSLSLIGLLITTVIAGLLQFICGAFGLGRLNRFIPQPVIAAFNAGIGILIILNELPRLFSSLTKQGWFLSPLSFHQHLLFLDTRTICTLTLWLGTMALVFLFQQVNKKMPAMFLAMICMTSLSLFFSIPTTTIADTVTQAMAATTTTLSINSASWFNTSNLPIAPLLLNGFALFLIASLETLFSANKINREINNEHYDVNQELIGQGLSNILLGLTGGLPATNLIYRSACNVKAGAKTRRASLIHALILSIILVYCVPWLLAIPIPVLAGVLLAFAISMIKWQEFLQLWQYARTDAFVYIITFVAIVSINLLAGIQAGIIAACVIIAFNIPKTILQLSFSQDEKVLRIACRGPLTFLSTDDIGNIKEKILQKNNINVVIMDLSRISAADVSGCEAIVDIYEFSQKQAISFFIVGLPKPFEPLFTVANGKQLLQQNNLLNEMELNKKTAQVKSPSPYSKLLHGLKCYYAETKVRSTKLYQHLAVKQEPHTLFITCSDSRIVPSLITATDPGELFMLRNVGNYIPAYSPDHQHSETAALTFAILNLNIRNIVICGHANCGAMQACHADSLSTLPYELQHWIAKIRGDLKISSEMTVNELAKQNVLQQIKNIQSYPLVQQRKQQYGITIHGWFFDVETAHMYAWDDMKQSFVSIGNDDSTDVSLEFES